MTRLYVPPLRKKFVLLEDWTFPLYYEMRNTTFASVMKWKWNIPDCAGYYYKPDPVQATLPKGTVMYIDRYYIKNGGQTDFDSITFRAIFGKKTQRFWVKLKDANTIEANFEIE